MFLLIDPSVKDQITLALFDNTLCEKKTYDVMNRAVLACIDALLLEKGMRPDGLKGVMIVVGAGGFSSTRIAVTVANTFAYVCQIPLLAVTEEQAKDPQSLIDVLLGQEPGKYIAPEYSGEPNITQSKKCKVQS